MQVAVPPENNQLAMNQDERRQAIKLVMELRSASEKKRALIKDPTMGKVDYDAAQDEWNRIYKEIFEAIAKKKLLHMLQYLDEHKEVLGDDSYYAGIVKLILDQDG